MMKLSVYIVTLNEEERLERTLEAASRVADELLVVDSGSSDRTEEIAKRYGARFEYHAWKNISSQKQYAQNACRYDWVLSLDADEVLSDKLIDEILILKSAVSCDERNVYRFRIVALYPGETKPGLFANSYNLVRLYNRCHCSMPDNLTHDRVPLQEVTRVHQMRYPVHHFSYITLAKLWQKYNAYSDELIKTAIASGKGYSRLRLLFEFPVQFLRYYLIRGQILHGMWDFISAVNSAYFRFLKVAKYIEYQRLKEKK